MNKVRHLFAITLLLLITILLGKQFMSPAFADNSAETAVLNAWQQAQEMEGYQYDSTLQQTDVPLPRLENIGRTPHTQHLFAEGKIEQANDLLQLNIWDDGNQIGNRANGMQIKIEDGQAYGRIADADREPLDNDVAGLFAPGQDTMGYLVAAENIVLLGQETRGGIAVTRYGFELSGPKLAASLRDISASEMRQRGELPPGVQLQAPERFVKMSGHGELWLDDAGLPLRQTIFMQFPPEMDNHQEIEIVTNYRQWQQHGLTGLAARQYKLSRYMSSPETMGQWQETAVFLILFLALVWLIINHARRRWFHRTLVGLILTAMLVGPLLQAEQISAFYEQNATTEPIQKNTAPVTQAQEAPFNPQLNPLTAVAAAVATPPTDDSIDTDGDGLSDALERRLGSDINNMDSDGDGLEDGIEHLQLGTSAIYTDTDSDLLADPVEVNGYQDAGGQWWYTDPTQPDSNRDGVLDGIECPQLAESPATACVDTDNDGLPDFADPDNDNDGVPDKDDLDMNLAMGGARDGQGHIQTFPDQTFNFDLTQMNVGQLHEVTLQFRPVNDNHLWYNMSVFDWPAADYYGNVQRADNDTTFQDVQSPSSSADANGDLRLIPMLEIEIPYQAGSYGGLPTLTTPAPLTVTNPITSWLDMDKAVEYGLTVNYKSDTDASLLIYAPVVVDLNNVTGDPIAFSARMPYWPQETALGTPHKIRLAWIVQTITNRCNAFAQEDGEIVGCDEWTPDQVQIVHTYNDDWYLTGIEAREDLGARMDIIHEYDPTAQPDYDSSSYYERDMWGLFNGLEAVFISGRVDNGERFDLTEIKRRFDITNTVPITERLGIDTPFAVHLWDFSESKHIVDVTTIHTRDTLNTYFPTTMVDDYVALTFATEFRSRSALLSAENGVIVTVLATEGLIVGNDLQINLDPVEVVPQTTVNLRWAPFQYMGAGEWAGQSPDLYLDYIEGRIANDLDEYNALAAVALPLGDLSSANGFDILNAAYYSRYIGMTNLVEVNGLALAPPTTFDDTLMQAINLSGDTGIDTVGSTATFVLALWDELKPSGGTPPTPEDFLAQPYNAAGAVFATVGATASVLSLVASQSGSPIMSEVFGVIKTAMDIADAVRVIAQGYRAGLSTISSTGATTNVLAIILVAVATIALFLFQVIANGIEWFGVAFNQALFQGVVASLIVAILFIALSATGVGALIVAIVGLIDGLINLVCRIINWVGSSTEGFLDNWICSGISGALTKVIGYLMYDQAPLIDMQNPDRLQFKTPSLDLGDPILGYSEGNIMTATMALTSTLYPNDPWYVLGSQYFGMEPSMRRTTLRYELTLQEEEADERFHIRAGIDTEQMTDEWIVVPTAITETLLYITDTVTVVVPLSDSVGINQSLSFYLAEGQATSTVECIPIQNACWLNDEHDTNYTNLGERYQFDVFPARLDEFLTLTRLDGYANGYAPLWSQNGSPAWPVQADADGDGLRSPDHPTMPGNDPNDSDADSDDDTLSDFYELKYNSDPQDPDTDDDGLDDAAEVYYGTNPRLADSDLDGLSDGAEIAGWAFVYAYDPVAGTSSVTWVTSDPLAYDTDGDEMTDLQEKLYGFNPRVYSADAVLSISATMSDADGYVAPGDVISYTAVISNETNSRQARGLLSVEFPAAVQDSTLDPKPFILNVAQSASLTGTLTVDPLAASQELTLTNRAGAVLVPQFTDQTLWLKFNEDSSTTNYYDDSRPQKTVTCSQCPTVVAGYQSNAARFDGLDDTLTIDSPALLGLTGPSFTVMGWVKYANDNGGLLMAKQQNSPLHYMAFDINNGQPEFTIELPGYQDKVQPPAATRATGVWYHMAWRYDGNSQQFTLFQDGVPLLTKTITQLPTAVIEALIGQSSSGNFFNGTLDNLEIYPQALSDTAIAQQVLKPAVHLNFENMTATRDLYGNQIRAREATTDQNDSIAQVSGVDGQAAYFDGRHNFYLQDTPATNRAAFTHAFWVRPSNKPGLQGIVGSSGAGSVSDLDSNGFSLNGSASIFVEDGRRLLVGFGDGSEFRTAVSDDILQPDEWNHVILTYGEDGLPQYKVYLNGRLRQTLAGTFASAAQNPTMPAHIGSATQHARVTYHGSYIYFTVFDNGGNNEFFYQLDDDNDPYNNVDAVRLNLHGSVSGGNTWITANPADGNDSSNPDRIYTYHANLVAFEDDGTDWFDIDDDNLTDDYWGTDPSYYDFDITVPSFDNEFIFTNHLTDSLKSEFIFGWRPLIDADDDDPGVLNIITSHLNPSQPFNGKLDDFRDYHRALNADEAAVIFGLAQPNGVRFNLDEPPASAEFADASGSSVQGSCNWVADTCPISGILGLWNQMALFGSQPLGDSNPNDYVSLPGTTINMAGQSYTVAAWVNGRNYTGETRPIFGSDHPGSPRLAIVDGYPVFNYKNPKEARNVITGTTQLVENSWYHLAVRHNVGNFNSPRKNWATTTNGATATLIDGSGAARVLDGDVSTKALSSSTANAWLRIDLGETRQLSEISIRFASDDTPSSGTISLHETNGGASIWQTTAVFADLQTFTTPLIYGRYLEIQLDGSANDPLKIYEVEIEGPEDYSFYDLVVNGQVEATLYIKSPGSYGHNNLYLGRAKEENNTFYQYYYGYLDQVKMYNEFRDVDQLLWDVPVLHLRFDEQSQPTMPTFINSVAGLPHAASNPVICQNNDLGNCPTAGPPGRFSRSVIFNRVDGTANDRLYTGLTDHIEDEVTISAWIKGTLGNFPSGRVVRIQQTNGVTIYADTQISRNGLPTFTVNGGTALTYLITDTLQPNQWYHIIWRLSAAENERAIFVNGQKIATGDAGTRPLGNLSAQVSGTNNGRKLFAQLDELSLQRIALTDAEIAELYTYQAGWYEVAYDNRVIIDDDAPTMDLADDLPSVLARQNGSMILSMTPDDLGASGQSPFASGVVQVQYKVNLDPGGGDWTSLPWNEATADKDGGKAWGFSITPDTTGTLGIQVRAIDAVGNDFTEEYIFTIDDTPPTATFAAAMSTLINTSVISDVTGVPLSGTSTDDISGVKSVEVTLTDYLGRDVNGSRVANYNAGTWQLDYPLLDSNLTGIYTATLVATDFVGNVMTETAVLEIDDSSAQAWVTDVQVGTPAAGAQRMASVTAANTSAVSSPIITYTTGTPITLTGIMLDADYPTNAALYLPFEEASFNGQVADASINYNAFICNNCPTSVTGASGQGADFNDTTDVTAVQPQVNLNQLTAAFWLKTSAVAAGDQTLLANGNALNIHRMGGGNQIGFTTKTDAGNSHTLTLTDTLLLPADTWTHLAFVYDGTAKQIYVNGTPVVGAPMSGTLTISDTLAVGSGLVGQMDELLFYQQAWPTTLINQMYTLMGQETQQLDYAVVLREENAPPISSFNWQSATISTTPNDPLGTWTASILDPVSGWYQIFLRTTDSSGRQQTARAWEGGFINGTSYDLTVNKIGDGLGMVSSDPVGIACGLECAQTFNYGTVVTLTAVAPAGSIFNGWSGGSCVGNATCTITMTTDITTTAEFLLDNSPLVGITVENRTIAVGEGGQTAVYTISLNTNPTAPVTITLGTDAQLQPLTQLVLSDTQPQTITVTALDDSLVEGDHGSVITHTVSSSDPDYDGAMVANVTVNLTDNDVQYDLAASTTMIAELDLGNTSTLTFTITRTGDMTRSSHVTFDLLASSATTGTDFNNVLVTGAGINEMNGMITFSAGAQIATISVDVLGDDVGEGDETIVVTLSSGTGTNGTGSAILTNNPVTTTIVDDDTRFTIFLPVVVSNYPQGADLIIEALIVDGNNIEVTIKNIGDTAVSNPFWVDVYIDPSEPPTAVNQTIETLNSLGAVWGVTVDLAAGETLTLRLHDSYYRASESDLPVGVVAGTAVYAQVDSAHNNQTYGAVYESHERRNESYNNILADSAH